MRGVNYRSHHAPNLYGGIMAKFEAYDKMGHGMRQRGFTMTFANGCTASVAFGDVNYCDQGETTAEVCSWNSDGDDISVDGFHDVIVPGSKYQNNISRLSPEDVIKYLAAVAAHEGV
jgi:hypothetical protein